MYTKEDVQRLVSDLGAVKSGKALTGEQHMHNVDFSEVEIGEPYMFGLALDIFDPVSGEVLRVCRPRHRATGEAEIFMTPTQIAAAIADARSFRLHNERAGLVPPRPQAEAAPRSEGQGA